MELVFHTVFILPPVRRGLVYAATVCNIIIMYTYVYICIYHIYICIHIYVRYLTIDAIMHHTLNIPGTQMTLL